MGGEQCGRFLPEGIFNARFQPGEPLLFSAPLEAQFSQVAFVGLYIKWLVLHRLDHLSRYFNRHQRGKQNGGSPHPRDSYSHEDH